MGLRVFLGLLATLLYAPTTAALAPGPTAPPNPPTQPTVNEFLPEERGLGECISAVPRPGCGSEARGGWRQTLVLVAILVGLALIVWRIVVSARAARRTQRPVSQP